MQEIRKTSQNGIWRRFSRQMGSACSLFRRLRALRDITNWVLMIFSVISVASLLSVVFAKSKSVTWLDTRLHLITDISAYGAMVFSAVALIISTVALKVAVKNPELTLEIDTGKQSLTCKPALRLEIHRDTKIVLDRQEYAHWRLFLNNVGNSSARYPIVQIEFHNVRLIGDVKGWGQISSSGVTNTVLRWSYPGGMDTVIHPNFPHEITHWI